LSPAINFVLQTSASRNLTCI